MRLHIFNPEHDMALASDQFNFVAPHAGREMRADLGFLPALWAADGDLVLVDDIPAALNRVRHLRRYAHDVVYVTQTDLPQLPAGCRIEPWGWDRALRFQLQRGGVAGSLLPTDAALDDIRRMSHRHWAGQHLLRRMVEADDELIGVSRLITNVEQLDVISSPYVMKAPWSSSGRGVRYVDVLTPHQRGWARNVIARQGGLMVEPYYHKLKDFAVELEVTPCQVLFRGLSVFQSVNGAYVGNVIATEAEKRDILARFIPFDRVERVVDRLVALLTDEMVGKYTGPLGIDMMVVDENGIKLHPCVELNLRRTMGHVALAFDAQPADLRRVMGIDHDGSYHFRVRTTAENCCTSLW